MTRSDPVRQLRAAVLWAANPLLLQQLIAGAHVDAQAVIFVVAAVAVMYGPGTGPRASVPSLMRGTLAGVLLGLGFAVKVSDALVGLGLAVALVLGMRPDWRRLLPPLTGLAAGFAATAGAAVALGGSAMLGQLSRESNLVSIASPWRVIRALIHLAVGGAAAADIVKAGAIALTVVLAVLLIRGLPQPGETVAFAVVLAWLFAWPYVLPWYDGLAWALLPLIPLGTAAADGICWLLLARTAALGFGYLPARQANATLPPGLSWLQPVIRHGVTPAILAAATVWLVVLMLRARRPGRAAAEETTGARLIVTKAP